MACLFLILLSCGSRDQFVGTYQAAAGGTSRQTVMLMELKANGEGTWRMHDEEVSFAWYVKDGELRINTKGGGVIVGTLEKDAVHVDLPGSGIITFRRVP